MVGTKIKSTKLGEVDIKLREICCIEATNRKVLIDNINKCIPLDWGENYLTEHPESNYLEVEFIDRESQNHPRSRRVYQTPADIPEHSVPCDCGNPNHWLIKYTDA